MEFGSAILDFGSEATETNDGLPTAY